MTPSSSEASAAELTRELSEALNAWRWTGEGILVLMLQVHPSERRGSWWVTTHRGIQLELVRRVRRIASAEDKLFALEDGRVVVVCRHVGGGDEARRMAERFTSEAAHPRWEDSALPVEISSGAVVPAARHANPEALLADVEKATRRAATGTGTQLVFLDELLWPDLVAGFSTLDPPGDTDVGGFHLDYQPIVAAADHLLWGMEALLRWEGAAPARGSALDLVHVAEQTGWIEPLGRWVMQEATSQTSSWARAGATDLIVFVNVSAIQLSSPRLIEDVDETLRITGLAPTHLGFDITTSALGGDQALHNLHALRGRGVTIALDDFEMEMSAMRPLATMPLDLIKLDASVVRTLGTPSARSLLTGIVSRARELGLAVIAKNVEAQSQLAMALEVGCDYLQGFAISPPLRAPALDEFIAMGHDGVS